MRRFSTLILIFGLFTFGCDDTTSTGTDSGPSADAGSAMDSGTETDSGTIAVDSGPLADTGPVDSGPAVDSGTPVDSDAGVDAGPVADAGVDGGPLACIMDIGSDSCPSAPACRCDATSECCEGLTCDVAGSLAFTVCCIADGATCIGGGGCCGDGRCNADAAGVQTCSTCGRNLDDCDVDNPCCFGFACGTDGRCTFD